MKKLFLILTTFTILFLTFFLGAYLGAIRERNKIEQRYKEVLNYMESDFSKHICLIYKDYIFNEYE